MPSASEKPDRPRGCFPPLSVLRLRHRVWQAVRAFLDGRGCIEVHTPVRVPVPALEDFIDAEPCGASFLRTSPELHMKRLLAGGAPAIYQIGPCFRQGEFGSLHLPEFTMLEWYEAGIGYRELLTLANEFLAAIASNVLPFPRIHRKGRLIELDAGWQVLPIEEAFSRYATEDLSHAVNTGRFEEILVSQVEPQLGWDCPYALIDYPPEFAGFAQIAPGPPARAERWELYIAGIEIGNACTELTDAAEQRRRMVRSGERRRQNGAAIYPIDEPFLAALENGMPPAAGIAIGLDRLLLVLSGATSLDEVVPFSEDP